MKTEPIRKNKRGYVLRDAAERNRLLELFKTGTVNASEFCREHEIHPTTFSGWLERTEGSGVSARRKKPRKTVNPVQFIEAQMPEMPGRHEHSHESSCMDIRLSGGASIRITKVNDVLTLGRWLKEVLSC